jgi:DNA-binding XRE family transcriptional regulator
MTSRICLSSLPNTCLAVQHVPYNHSPSLETEQDKLPNIAAILKQEITRLARREVRSLTKSLHKASAQFRREIAELKRQSSKAQAEIVRLARSNGGALQPKVVGADAEGLRFTVRSVASQRKRLGISAAECGKLIGVTAHTVYSWEHGTSKPRKPQLAALAALRGLGKREARQRLEHMNGKGATRGM